uniref:Calponin-homology (CH) domain-containing protein n=1 Tax=Meloidogyne javanica TaxID=6303 RepID=A0A915MS53_MELJA
MLSNHSTQQTEVKLLKDEKWKVIQQNTFTRWVNKQLKHSANSPQLENLVILFGLLCDFLGVQTSFRDQLGGDPKGLYEATDFADGIFLIKLAEVLSGKGLPRFNKKPIMRTQKLDNVSLVLNFFQNQENIKIVNIDSSHIVDHNLKLILGLVWTLILHYSLSHQHFTPADTTTSPTTITNGSDKKETPKQRLLAWIQGKIPGRRVANFTSTWNDGITLGALVDACTNGSLNEWINWESTNALENTQKAMQAAERLLGVEKLLTPEELSNPAVDEKSVMTYLAQFPKAQPLKQSQKSSSLSISGIDRHHIVSSVA